jgi:hypothetical protein
MHDQPVKAPQARPGPPSAVTAPAMRKGGGIQRQLRGATYAEGEALLAPVQREGEPGKGKPAKSGAGAASTSAPPKASEPTPSAEVSAPSAVSSGPAGAGAAADKVADTSAASPSVAPAPASGLSVWRREMKRLSRTIPGELIDAKKVHSRDEWDTFTTDLFMSERGALEADGFGVEATTADIAAKAAEREAMLRVAALKETQRIKAGAVPTKGNFWNLLGWTLPGKAWDLRQLAVLPSGRKCHLTASGDSIIAPSTAAASEVDIMYKSPEAVFDALFTRGIAVGARVHVTRELGSAPSNHIYLGNVNGAGAAVGDGWFEGDAATMKQHLAAFRADAIRRIGEAQLSGWSAG